MRGLQGNGTTSNDNLFCNVTFGDDVDDSTFQPAIYQASSYVTSTNRNAIRFGASRDMMTLLQGTQAEKNKYLQGLVATSVVMALLFLLWCFFIVLFRFMGYRRCGFLCGRFIRPKPPPKPFTSQRTSQIEGDDYDESPSVLYEQQHEYSFQDREQNSSPYTKNKDLRFDDEVGRERKQNVNGDDDDEETPGLMQKVAAADDSGRKDLDYMAWSEAGRKQQTRLFRTRIVLILSCVIISTLAIFFCIYGTKYINQSINKVFDGLQHVKRLCQRTMVLLDKAVLRQNETEAVSSQEMSTEYNTGFCPKVHQPLCRQVDPEIQNCNFTGIPYVADVFETLYVSKPYMFDGMLEKMRLDLQDMYNQLDAYANGQYHLEWIFWISFSFTVALIVCCLGIVFAIYQAHRGKLGSWGTVIRRRLLFPIFFILVVVAASFAMAFTIASVGTSDWCISSPNAKVTTLLDQNQQKLDSTVYQMAKYYVNSCQSDLKPVKVNAPMVELGSMMQNVTNFARAVQTANPQAWAFVCGSDVSILQNFGRLVENLFCLLSYSLDDVRQFLACRFWNPVYTAIMYEAICYDAQNGLLWVAITMFCVVVFALLVLLLRAGAFDIEDEEEYERSGGCCSRPERQAAEESHPAVVAFNRNNEEKSFKTMY